MDEYINYNSEITLEKAISLSYDIYNFIEESKKTFDEFYNANKFKRYLVIKNSCEISEILDKMSFNVYTIMLKTLKVKFNLEFLLKSGYIDDEQISVTDSIELNNIIKNYSKLISKEQELMKDYYIFQRNTGLTNCPED